MKNLTLIFILLAIISLSSVLYFLLSHFSPPAAVISQVPTDSISPTSIPTQPDNNLCKQNQLVAKVSSQGAAGNIYDTLTITNTANPCEIVLGNTIMVNFSANNIVLHKQKIVSSQNYLLATNAKVYSQLHYPNGPQCQKGIAPKPITILYKVGQTSVPFVPDVQTGKVEIQACSSDAEKTTVDVWPLSKNPTP
jgi:hypothetical protein